VDVINIRRPWWVGHGIRLKEEKSQKGLLMGTSTTKDQQENQEKDGRTLSRGMHYRSQDYEDEGDELRLGKNGGAF
jgi:hypothetical protein